MFHTAHYDDQSLGRGTMLRGESLLRFGKWCETNQPVHRLTLGRFHRQVYEQIRESGPRQILDFGCGEVGFWAGLARLGPLPEILGIDLRRTAIAAARIRFAEATVVRIDFFDVPP